MVVENGVAERSTRLFKADDVIGSERLSTLTLVAGASTSSYRKSP